MKKVMKNGGRSTGAFSVLVLMVFLGGWSSAQACDCKGISGTATDAYKRAEAVLIGKVVKEDDRSAYFRVAKFLKGGGLETARVFASEISISDTQVLSACDRHFKVGTSYIVFARKSAKNGQLFADPCAPHCEAGEGCSTKVLAELKPLYAPGASAGPAK